MKQTINPTSSKNNKEKIIMERLGCSDNNCKLEPPKTGTNGGCTCLDGLSTEKRIRVEKYILKLKELIKLLQKIIKEENCPICRTVAIREAKELLEFYESYKK